MHKHLIALLTVFSFVLTPLSVTRAAAPDGSLIKTSSNSAVYYLLKGKRYVFPYESVYYTWYSDFSKVLTVSTAELLSYPMVGNVTYRPGLRLLKLVGDPKIYAVSRYGTLRWITSPQIATTLYGTNWGQKVRTLPDGFWVNYTLGSPITGASQYNVSQELTVANIWQDIKNAEAPKPSPTPEPTPEPTPTPSPTVANISGCQVFPADNAWNQDVSKLPVHPKSATYINSIGASTGLHADFGENQTYGIPFNVVSGSQPKVPITWTAYGDESDPGPYPIPSNAKVESGSDAHVLVLDKDNCKLYELYAAEKNSTGWSADSGAIWDLSSNALRPWGWTSADAAGLPILPGLVRYEEVAAGEIKHAIRFTASPTQAAAILPATHYAGQNNTSLPPMGLRVRMKADYDISKLTGQAKVIATAMKKYGMILADNGSDWYFSGATNPGWNDDELNQLKKIPGSAFEAVDTGPIKK